jgi:hypothetical protein
MGSQKAGGGGGGGGGAGSGIPMPYVHVPTDYLASGLDLAVTGGLF